MKFISSLLFVLAFAWLEPAMANEDDDDMSSVIGLMVVAKATGMCGVFAQMVNFQRATKMPGGDEFIVRFLNTEAVRLGHTLDSFMEQCPVMVKKYTETMKMLGSDL